jgi:hypothetical protein
MIEQLLYRGCARRRHCADEHGRCSLMLVIVVVAEFAQRRHSANGNQYTFIITTSTNQIMWW